jgi:tRNA (guanine37-N1)-methyltransferase
MDILALTIFPELFSPFREFGMVKRALDAKKITVSVLNIRDFATNKHHSTDDKPFGGGSGMVMMPEPLALCIEKARSMAKGAKTILLSPQGSVFDQKKAVALSREDGLILVCGRYEGVDERICQEFIDEELSIGDFVLTGGELAAMVVIEAVIRHIPEVLGGIDSAEKDSFSNSLLEHAHYTRPRNFRGNPVPEVLTSGNHRDIEAWRMESSLIRTFLKRPDLLKGRTLSWQEKNILKKWCSDIESIIEAQPLPGPGALPGDQQSRGDCCLGRDESGSS